MLGDSVSGEGPLVDFCLLAVFSHGREKERERGRKGRKREEKERGGKGQLSEKESSRDHCLFS